MNEQPWDKKTWRPVLLLGLVVFPISLLIRDWVLAFLIGFANLGLLQLEIPWERWPNARRLALALFVASESSFLVFFLVYVVAGDYSSPTIAAVSVFVVVMLAWPSWQWRRRNRS